MAHEVAALLAVLAPTYMLNGKALAPVLALPKPWLWLPSAVWRLFPDQGYMMHVHGRGATDTHVRPNIRHTSPYVLIRYMELNVNSC